MSMDRRNFIRTSALAGAALGLSNSVAALAAGGKVSPSGSPMNVLVLGGTGFIGPPMVEYLLARGHKVTLFNRGQTNTDLFPGVERLVGDRNDNLEALEGREWDVVFDNHATLPRWVRQTAELLKGSVGRYIHVSTISVTLSPISPCPMTGPRKKNSGWMRMLRCPNCRGLGWFRGNNGGHVWSFQVAGRGRGRKSVSRQSNDSPAGANRGSGRPHGSIHLLALASSARRRGSCSGYRA